MVTLTPRKHCVFFSLESRQRAWLSPWGGPYRCPQMERLARRSVVFDGMTAAGSSTSLVLSSTFAGRYPFEFDRADYAGTTNFADNLLDAMSDRGRRVVVIGSETFFSTYFPKIHEGSRVERVVLPDAGFSTTRLARSVIEIMKDAVVPTFVFAHPLPLNPCARDARPDFRNEMERFIWEDDLAIGMLQDELDLDETRLLVLGDHGNSLGEHGGVFSHAFYVWETQVAVPCMVTDDRPGRVTETTSSTQIRDLLLHHRIEPKKRVFADTLYVLQPHRVTMVREDDWKYVAHYSWATAVTGLQEELYDLRLDPGEHRNLLYDRALHPLRGDFNRESAWTVPGHGWGYDAEIVEEAARRGREVIGEIWTAGFLRELDRIAPDSRPELERKLALTSPTARLGVIGTLVEQCQNGPVCYEKLAPGMAPPALPHAHPGLPLDRRNTNWSAVGAGRVKSILVDV